jgi:hypothetical protein
LDNHLLMNYLEEQEQEVEALQSIYMDDFVLLEKNKYEITLRNEPEEEIQVQIKLSVEYPEKYPEVLCYFSIESLDLTRTECENLLSNLTEVMEENLGTGVLVFNLTTHIQDYLSQYSSKKEEENEFKKIQKEKEEEKERLSKLNRFVKDSEIDFIEDGNPVTLENFAQWKLQFDKEYLEKKEKKESKKLTGREIFEQKVKGVVGVDPDAEMFDDDLFLE